MGLAAILAGLAIGVTALGLGVQGWEISRLWFYMVGSAMIFLVGVQLVVYWLLLRILEELSQRETLTAQDIGAGEA
jgi:hypothetical protein